MCQLKAEAKEAYTDYLPFRGAIFGCSAAANAKLRAAAEGTPREGRCSWDPLPSSVGTEARLLFCSLEDFFRWQRVPQRKLLGMGQKDLRVLSSALPCPMWDWFLPLHCREIPRLLPVLS